MEPNRRTATWAGAVLGIMVALAVNVVLAHASEEGDRTLTEEFHHTYPLAANGTIELENINGAVHITAWDRNEVKVDAVKRAYDQEELNEAEIEVSDRPDFISIRTKYRHQDWNHEHRQAAEVEYTLSVPGNSRLNEVKLINGPLEVSGVRGEVRASCINGKLMAHGLAANVELSTINGPLEASFEQVGSSPIELSSVNGPLRLTLPSDVKATIDATTVHGGIQNEFGLHSNNHQFVGHLLRGELGGGGTEIKLRNVNGKIDISHANDGRALSPARNRGDSESEI